MSNRNARFGTQRERQVVEWYRDRDWIVTRTPGSRGTMDLIACKDGNIDFVQVKGTVAGPYAGFPPHERAKLKGEAIIAGARARLAWWPSRAKLRVIDADEWP